MVGASLSDTLRNIVPLNRKRQKGGSMGFWEWLRQGGDYVLVVCSAVVTVCLAANWLHKVWRRARKPHLDLEARVDALASDHASYETYFERDKVRLDGTDEDLALLLTAVMQLITHEIDGNHVDKLRGVRDSIHEHLISRARNPEKGSES